MKTVVITGASRGIGYETAKKFVAEGYRVFSLSRSGGAPEGAEGIACDVSDAAQARAAVEEAARRGGGIDILVNNAGFGISGSVEYTPPERFDRITRTNFLGVAYVTQAALPELRRSRGRIISLSSVAAVMPIAFQTFYSATKAAVLSFSECLRNEVRPFGVQVCCALPGDAKSDFTAAREKTEGEGEYAARVARSVSQMERDEENGMSAAYVAEKLVRLAERRKLPSRYIVGGSYRFLCFLGKLLPQRLVLWILYRMYAK